jgi:hypothetical protein
MSVEGREDFPMCSLSCDETDESNGMDNRESVEISNRVDWVRVDDRPIPE